MFINKTSADINIGYNEGVEIVTNLGKSNSYCKLVGRVSKIETKLDYDSDCISHYKISLQSLNKKYNYIIKSYGVQKGDENRNCGNEIGLYSKIEGKTYNPQIGDYIIAKINPENNYINELYDSNKKSINDLDYVTKKIPLSYCTGNIVKDEAIKEISQETEKVQPINNTQNYYLFGIIIFLIMIIGILLYKIYSRKN